MSLYTKMRRIFTVGTMLRVFDLQTRVTRTCKANVLNKLTLLDINHKVHKPPVTKFCRRVEVDAKTKDFHLRQELYRRSFRKSAMQHQNAFKLNGFFPPMTSLGTYKRTTTTYPFVTNWRWYVTSKDQGGPVKQSGGGLGKIDAKGEAGFFHKVNLSRLEQIKKMLKEKRLRQKDAPKDDSDAKK